MSYFAPYIDETGLHIPTYADILADLISSLQTIYGQDIYLENDSQDYQLVSAFALKIFDTMQALQYAYDSRSPLTAIGSALDSIVKLNGIIRKGATYSTCPATLAGTVGLEINNGIVQDESGYKWNLPSLAVIGPGGTVDCTVTCQEPGPILAGVGDINQIITPVYGWNSVTNSVSATPGTLVETDSELRSRQAISKANSSETILDGLKGGIAAVVGVTRYKVYENQTDSVDANGLPAHSVGCVVEGGTDANVAQAIYDKRGIGCFTYGTTSVNITDDYGQITPIGFYRPGYINPDVAITVKMLTGYVVGTTGNEIKTAVKNALDDLGIGNDLSISYVWGVALSVIADFTNPTFSVTAVTICEHGGTPGTADIVVDFNEAIQGILNYITITET